MKISGGEKIYAAKLNSLRERQNELYEKKQALKNGEIDMSDEQADELGKAIDKIDFQCGKMQEKSGALKNNAGGSLFQEIENSRRQSEAMADAADEYIKCLEVARRISRGDKVPAKDEKKLLDFNAEMYQMAKSMAAIAQNEKAKKHKSLWKDEDENKSPVEGAGDQNNPGNPECGAPAEVPDVSEAAGAAPELDIEL